MAGPIRIAILANASQASRSVDQFAGKTEKSVGRVSKAAKVAAGAVAAAFAARKVVSGLKSLSDTASDAQQSIGAVESVYGKYANRVIKLSNRAAMSVGLSANEYRELNTVMGSMLKNSGTAQDKLATKTDRLVRLGADLAATYGGTTKDAVESISSLMRGEADPIEKYGVSIKQSDVSARLAAQGLDKLTGQKKKEAEATARLYLLYRQTTAAQGQFGRESKTWAGQQQRMTAQWQNIKATIGSALLPALTAVGVSINRDVLPPVQQLAEKYAPMLGAKLEGLATKIGPAFSSAASAVSGWIQGMKTGDASADLSSIGDSLGKLGPAVASAAAALPSFNDLLSVSSTVLAFAADHTDLLAKVLPVLATGYVAVKVGQLAANAAQVVSVPMKVAEVVVNRQLVKSNQALIASRAGLTTATVTGTAAENAGVLTRARAVAGMLVQKTVTLAVSAATKAWAATQWLLNAAMTASPIGIVVVSIVALVGAAVLAYRKVDWFRAGVNKSFSLVVAGGKGLWAGIQWAFGKVRAFIGVVAGAVRAYIGLYVAAFRMIVSAAQSVWSGVSGAFGRVVSFVRGVPGKIKAAFGNARSMLSGIGGQIIDGLRAGIEGAWHLVTGAVDRLVSKIPKKIRELMGIASPSKVTTRLGRYIAQGLAKGLLAGAPETEKAVRKLADVLAETLPKRLKSDRAIRAWRKSHAKELKQATAATLKAVRADALAVLAARKQQAKEYAKSVKDAVVSYAGIGNIQLGENETLTAGSVKNYLADRLSQIKTFSAKLAALAKKGLSKDLYNQIVQMGPEQGLAYAEALAQASPAQLAELNRMQARIQSASSQLGSSTAATMYQSGIDSAQGFVNGLNKLMAQVAKTGTKMSKQLVKAVKKALGIKSPSRVFAGLGEQVTAGLTVGVDLSNVRQLGTRMATQLETGFRPSQLVADASVAGGAGGNTYEITVQVPVTANPAEVGRQVVKAIDAFEKSGGRRAA